MRQIKRKYYAIVFSALMSTLMSLIMSFAITFYQFGFSTPNILKGFKAWGFSFPFAFITAQFVGPLVMRLTKKIVEE